MRSLSLARTNPGRELSDLRAEGKTFYTAIYGVFESHDRAVRARSALPAALWVRKFAAVQKLIVP